ncbi:MAG: FHA domain-containing protein [Mediterranea sp.]|jgi:hypothetical protein|nr:FHA domain-containing protein [Mediterranea sp.]
MMKNNWNSLKKKLMPENAEVRRWSLVNRLVKELNIFGYDEYTELHGLTVYLSGQEAGMLRGLVEPPVFKEDLLKKFREKKIKVTDPFLWEVKMESPPEGAKEIEPGVWLMPCYSSDAEPESEPPATGDSDEKSVEPLPVTTGHDVTPSEPLRAKARVKELVEGTLMKRSYSLDADRQRKFNIGRGEKSGTIDVNHIVVDQACKSISRQHALIDFDPREGFVLQAREGGNPHNNNDTLLHRDDGDIRLTNSRERQPLRDGDIIILGPVGARRGNVALLFEFDKEEERQLQRQGMVEEDPFFI